MKAEEVRQILKDEAEKNGFKVVYVSVRRCCANLQNEGSSEVRLVDWSYQSNEDTLRYLVKSAISDGLRLDRVKTSKYYAQK